MYVCVCVFFLLVFLYRPGGAKGPKYVFRKRPGHSVNAPGRLFTPSKYYRPRRRLLALLRYVRTCNLSKALNLL